MLLDLKEIKVGENAWVVQLSEQGEVSFYYKIFVKETNPLWFDFDGSDPDYYVRLFDFSESEVYDLPNLEKPILPAVTVMRKIVDAVLTLVRKNHLNGFYFAANTPKKKRLYTVLAEKYKDQLTDWTYQIAGQWIFFNKVWMN